MATSAIIFTSSISVYGAAEVTRGEASLPTPEDGLWLVEMVVRRNPPRLAGQGGGW
jgi:hypothetical protein